MQGCRYQSYHRQPGTGRNFTSLSQLHVHNKLRAAAIAAVRLLQQLPRPSHLLAPIVFILVHHPLKALLPFFFSFLRHIVKCRPILVFIFTEGIFDAPGCCCAVVLLLSIASCRTAASAQASNISAA